MSTTLSQTKNSSTRRWGLTASPEKAFTADDMLDAYEQGKLAGINHYSEQLKENLLRNLNKALPEVERFYNSLPADTKQFMMLQIASINYFQVIVAISKEVFFDDEKCRPIYESSFEVSKRYDNINISFIPYQDKESINLESLIADNYLFVYDLKE
jgi:selenocysteine lyase/cysteine desulfurase